MIFLCFWFQLPDCGFLEDYVSVCHAILVSVVFGLLALQCLCYAWQSPDSVFRWHVPVLSVFRFRKEKQHHLLWLSLLWHLSSWAYLWVSPIFLFHFLLGKIYLLLGVPFCSIHALQLGFLLLNDKIVPFQMLLTRDSFWLPTLHQQDITFER